MKINNRATNSESFKFNFYSFVSARKAFEEILQLPDLAGKKLLLPAFIGQSDREGSGVFDPVRNTKYPFEFYEMDLSLTIETQKLKDKIKKNPGSILLLIHYWGFIDPSYQEIKAIAKESGCLIIEDFAHGLFSFFQKPVVDFDYGFFSLHKMFSYKDGGILISKKELNHLVPYDQKFYEFNLTEISNKRVQNYNFVLELLSKNKNIHLKILRENFGYSVPQTFPLLMSSNKLKDYLYFKMNEAGFGVVSLYHQLIHEVDDKFVNERAVSSRILNLPIHQDADNDSLKSMVELLLKMCNEYEG